uniref:Uncharacterized protein n=1 Tax=Xenopus tropicalis TaxID=8364 RepID=A0A1B8Y9K4_XENTR
MGPSCWNHPTGPSCWNHPIGTSCWNHPIGTSCWNHPIGNSCWNHPIGTSCWNHPIGTSCWNHPIGTSCWNHPIGPSCWNHPIGPSCWNHPIGPSCWNHPIGPSCWNHPIGPSCWNHLIGPSCWNHLSYNISPPVPSHYMEISHSNGGYRIGPVPHPTCKRAEKGKTMINFQAKHKKKSINIKFMMSWPHPSIFFINPPLWVEKTEQMADQQGFLTLFRGLHTHRQTDAHTQYYGPQ